MLVMFTRGYARYFNSNPTYVRNWEVAQTLNPPCVLLSDNWIWGMAVSYLAKCKYYGVTSTYALHDSNILKQELEQGQVTHFLAYDGGAFAKVIFLTPSYIWNDNNTLSILYTYNK